MGFSLDEGREYQAPLAVNTIKDAATEIEKLSKDHAYKHKPKDWPYLGVITDFDSLLTKLEELRREGMTIKNINAHCSTGMKINDVGKMIKTVTFLVYPPGERDAMYLDYILDLQDIDGFSPRITDEEASEIVDVIKEKFGVKVSRRGSTSGMWVSEI